MSVTPEPEKQSQSDRFKTIVQGVNDLLGTHNIDLSQSTGPEGRKEQWQGKSGRQYAVTIKEVPGIDVTLSSEGETWHVTQRTDNAVFNSLFYTKGQPPKITTFGSYNMSEAERHMRSSNPDMGSVDPFQKFDELIEDLSS